MKIRLLAGLAIGSLALTACASGPTATTTSSAPAQAPSTAAMSSTPTASGPAGSVAGTLTIWADDKRAEALKDVAKDFESKNQGIKVNIQAVSKDLQSVFLTASQAGNSPDIVIGAHDWIGNFVQNGAISPVTIANKGAFDAKSIAAVTYDGQTYGVPYTRNNIALIRNTELAPNAPATLDDLVATGKQLKSSGKASEILALQVGQNGDVFHMQPLMAAGGGSFFTYDAAANKWDATKLTLDSPETIAAMEKLKAIGEKGEGALKRSIDDKNAISTFASKKSAYLISGPWALTDIKKAGIKYDITAIPTWKEGGKPAAPFYGADAFFVAAKGKNAALAQEFANNYVGIEATQEALYKAEPRPPALTAAFDKVKGSDPDLQKFMDAGKDAIPMPSIPAMGKVWDPVGKAEAAIIGGADVATTLKAAQATLKAAIG